MLCGACNHAVVKIMSSKLDNATGRATSASVGPGRVALSRGRLAEQFHSLSGATILYLRDC